MMPDDPTLRDAYRRRPRPASAGMRLPPETLGALARGEYAGNDREALLDRVLADPDQAAEFHFLHDVGRRRELPRRSWWAGSRGLALAAGGLFAIFAGTQLIRAVPDDPLRSGARITLHEPSADARIPPGDSITFTWSPVAGAVEYEVNVAAADGTELLRAARPDTSFRGTVPAGADTWWVSARRADGTTERSLAQALNVR